MVYDNKEADAMNSQIDSQKSPASDLEWLARNVSEWPLRSGGSLSPNIAITNTTLGFTREQWAAERQRLGLDQEWDEGLPSVGDQLWVTLRPDEDGCRIADFDDVTVEVIGLAQTSAGDLVVTFAHPTLGLGCGRYDPSVFRPARTPEEVEREQAIIVAITALGKMNACIVGHWKVLGALYDAGLLRKGEPS